MLAAQEQIISNTVDKSQEHPHDTFPTYHPPRSIIPPHRCCRSRHSRHRQRRRHVLGHTSYPTYHIFARTKALALPRTSLHGVDSLLRSIALCYPVGPLWGTPKKHGVYGLSQPQTRTSWARLFLSSPLETRQQTYLPRYHGSELAPDQVPHRPPRRLSLRLHTSSRRGRHRHHCHRHPLKMRSE